MNTPTTPRILVVDDQYAASEPHRAEFLRAVAPPAGGRSYSFVFDPGPTTGSPSDTDAFCDRVAREWGDIENGVSLAMVLLDVHFGTAAADLGFQLLDRLRADPRFGEALPIVMLTSEGAAKRQRASLGRADGFLPKADDITLRPLLSYEALHSRVMAFGLVEDGRVGMRHIIGRSYPLLQMLREARRYASGPLASRVLFGETGTGKNELGEYIHHHSGRPGPYVKWVPNTANDDLLASSLMGHWKGAFTGAEVSATGQIELAHTGSFLLDEVSYLTPSAQDLLVTFRRREGTAQRRRITRLGAFSNVTAAKSRTGATAPVNAGTEMFKREHQIRGELDPSTGEISIDVLFYCATNIDLRDEEERRRRHLREDLYVELGAPLLVPSLNDRRVDVPLIVDHLVQLLTAGRARPVSVVSAVRDELAAADWTNRNIPELRKVVESALVKLGPDFDVLAPDHLPEWFRAGQRSTLATPTTIAETDASAKSQAEHRGGEALISAKPMEASKDPSVELIRAEAAYLGARVDLLRRVLEETRKPGPRGPGPYQAERAIGRLFGREVDGTDARRQMLRILVSDLETETDRDGADRARSLDDLRKQVEADQVLNAMARWARKEINFTEVNKQLHGAGRKDTQ